MAAPLVVWTDSSDLPFTPSFTWAGTPTSEIEVRLHNNLGGAGADTMRNVRVTVLERLPSESEWVATGRQTVDSRAVEIRILGGIGGLSVGVSGYVGVGDGSSINLPDIAQDQAVRLGVRVNAPLSIADSTM